MSANMPHIIYDKMTSPVGELLLAAHHDGLTHLLFTPSTRVEQLTQSWLPVSEGEQLPDAHASSARAHVLAAREQLEEYFAGLRQTFTVPLAATGTPFQRGVWQALTNIPYGQTWSYRDVALHIGNPKAVRAVGLANGRNPISIIVPCHRVIGANGALTGYGGGIERKQKLLALESGVALSSFATG